MSLSIQRGQIVGLLGPNGAGKTTCFHIILGLTHPETGTVTLNGQDITTLPIHRRAHLGLGYLPQEPSVFRKLSVADNIMAILEIQRDLTHAERHTQLNTLLEDFHLQHLQHNQAVTLSGGERRRVEIARALASRPQFMLLDEPFAGVDPISILDIKRIIRELARR